MSEEARQAAPDGTSASPMRPRPPWSEGHRLDEIERVRRILASGTSVLWRGVHGSDVHDLASIIAADRAPSRAARLQNGLDELSASGIEALTALLSVPSTLVSAHGRRGAGLPRALAALVDEGRLVILELASLPPMALQRYVESVLGGELDVTAVEMLVPARAADDTDLLRSAAEQARDEAAIILDPRTGRWTRGAPWRPTTLRRSLLERMPSTDPPSSGELIVDLLGLVPAVGLEAALDIADIVGSANFERHLESFEDAGVIAVSVGARGHSLRLADGVHELVASRSLGDIRRRRVSTAVLKTLGRVPADEMTPAELIAWVDLALERHDDLPAESLVLAARAAVRDAEPSTARRIAEAGVAAGGGFDAQMVLAAAELRSGSFELATERIAHLSIEAENDGQRADATAALARLAATRPQAARLLEQDVDTILRTGGRSPDDLGKVEIDRLRIQAIDAYVLFALGDAVGAATLLEPTLETFEGAEKANALYVYASGAFLSGRLSAAEKALDAADSILVELGQETFASHFLRCVIDQFTGDIARSIESARGTREAMRAVGSADALAMTEWTEASLALAEGRAPEAADLLRPIVETMEQHGMGLTARTVRADLAEALVLSGRVDSAEEALLPVLLAAADSAQPPGQDHRVLQVRAWIRAARGDLTEARRNAVRSANIAAARGSRLPELVALSEAARFGAASELIARVDQLATLIDGAYASLAARYTKALAALENLGDEFEPREARVVADELDAVGVQADECGRHAIAAEAFARAARLCERTGDERDAARLRGLRDDQMRRCGVDSIVLVPAIQARPLSLREAEIADLAAAGQSNREISAELVLSIRTVETHLLRVYQKLGIRRRGQLAGALRNAPRAQAEEV